MKHSNLLRKPFKYVYWNATLIIIGINVLFYIFTDLIRIIPNLKSYLALNVINIIRYKMYWQFITYMFTHGDFMHIAFNMIGLLIFGITVERRMGSKEFIFLYLFCGLFSGAVSFAIYYFTGMYGVFLLGASGAIYGVLLSYAVLFPASIIYIWGILPVPAPILIAIYAAIEIFSQIFGSNNGIANSAHLAGFAGAWLYFVVRMGINPWKVWKQHIR